MGHVQTFRLLLECVRSLFFALVNQSQGADLSIYGVHGSVLEVCSQSPFQEEIALAVSQLRGAAQMQSLTLQVLYWMQRGTIERRNLRDLAAPEWTDGYCTTAASLAPPQVPRSSQPPSERRTLLYHLHENYLSPLPMPL